MKNLLNEEQDPKAVEKITSKLNDPLMKSEEIAYIGVQKKPALTVFPDSIVLTNKRIIMCKPKNLGLSMDFTDYSWEEVAGMVVKENIFGSEFSFSTKTDVQVSIDYIPKTQARKIYTYAKEQQELLKENQQSSRTETQAEATSAQTEIAHEIPQPIAEMTEILPVSHSGYRDEKQHPDELSESDKENPLADLSDEELFEKLQNYKKLLDGGLITQSEYDAMKKEILLYM